MNETEALQAAYKAEDDAWRAYAATSYKDQDLHAVYQTAVAASRALENEVK